MQKKSKHDLMCEDKRVNFLDPLLSSHWVKKGEGQNRAAVFQNFVKQDKRKKDKMDKTLLRP